MQSKRHYHIKSTRNEELIIRFISCRFPELFLILLSRICLEKRHDTLYACLAMCGHSKHNWHFGVYHSILCVGVYAEFLAVQCHFVGIPRYCSFLDFIALNLERILFASLLQAVSRNRSGT